MRFTLVVLLAVMPFAAEAQIGVPIPTSLQWERVGQTVFPGDYSDIEGIDFCGDTLFAALGGLPHALRDGGPGYPAANGIWERRGLIPSGDIECVSLGDQLLFFIDRGPSFDRSRDWGYTVEPVLYNGKVLPVRTPGGAIVAYFDYADYIVCRSDDGEAWACGDYTPGDTGFPSTFDAGRPGGPVPAARMLANGQGGPAFSDDDGRTWQPSNLMTSFNRYGAGLAVVDGGPLHGTAVAVATNGMSAFHVYQSTDGRTWTDLGPTPVEPRTAEDPWRFETRLVAIPGGLVARYGDGPYVWLSGDAGRTWQVGFDSGGPPVNVDDEARDAAVGPDGHLYIGIESGTAPPTERGGVYRSAVPLAAVVGEALPAEASGVGVAVRPNPVGGRAEVVVTLASAGVVRVVVLDALGREVAVVLDGDAPAGERVLSVETGGWPAGVYVVRATTGTRTATARLVVVR